jgi:hypothetical protein
MTTPTVFNYYSELTGSPTLNGTAGSLIAVLDACLVNGFALKTADSVVVNGGKATINISAGHAFEQDIVVLVAGATPSGLNGLKTIESRTTNTAVFDATGIADGAATGTITVKIAPAGYEKVFSGTNIAVYRTTDVTGARMYLRVDDTSATNARVVGYESMSDVNTGTGPFPTSAQISGGGYWPKANAAGATARGWTVIADSRFVYVHTHAATSQPGIAGPIHGAGDILALDNMPAYAAAIFASPSDISSGAGGATTSIEWIPSSSAAGPYMMRNSTGLGGSVAATHCNESYPCISTGSSGGVNTPSTPVYPNGSNNALILTRKTLTEAVGGLRGLLPGIYLTTQNCHASFPRLEKVAGQGNLVGRKLLAVKCGGANATASQGVVFFDITGPWR